MPIVIQEKFSSEMSKPIRSPQVTSLSYAMATLGASLMDGYTHIKDKCYQLSREYFEVCEREEDGANLMSIEALQACILITCSELKGKGFARAWMTLGKDLIAGHRSTLLLTADSRPSNQARSDDGFRSHGFSQPLCQWHTQIPADSTTTAKTSRLRRTTEGLLGVVHH